jgi:hypothetical protein
MKASGPAAASATLTLEIEHSIVRGAIELVARGVSTRVACAGLRFAGQLLQIARAEAAGSGVEVAPIWSLDEEPTGLIVSRAADA